MIWDSECGVSVTLVMVSTCRVGQVEGGVIPCCPTVMSQCCLGGQVVKVSTCRVGKVGGGEGEGVGRAGGGDPLLCTVQTYGHFTMATSVSAVPAAWRYRNSARAGWPCVFFFLHCCCVRYPGLAYDFYLSVAALWGSK